MKLISSILLTLSVLVLSCNKDEAVLPTIITATDFSASIDENPSGGQTIGMIAASTNQGTLTFTLVSQSIPDALAVNSTSGQISVLNASKFDFETNPTLSGVVKLSSNGTEKNVTITVTLKNVVERRALQSLNFDGLDDRIEFGDVVESDQLSVTAWINTSVSNTRIVSKFGAVWQYELKITTDGALEFGVGIASGFVVAQGGTGLADGNWHHVASTWDGTTIKLYIDGVAVGSKAASGTLVTGSDPLFIGSWGGTYEFYKGMMTDVALWNTALTAGKVSEIHSSCSLFGTEDGLKLLIDFNESKNSSVVNQIVDISSSRINGSFKGGSSSASYVTTRPSACN